MRYNIKQGLLSREDDSLDLEGYDTFYRVEKDFDISRNLINVFRKVKEKVKLKKR